tara:strand:- start:8 stop:778 length:771 start_codon:yes stop_codon:yes gene_type:complete
MKTNGYYIESGEGHKMFTLRHFFMYPTTHGFSESDTYVKNLSTNYDEAYSKAVKFCQENNYTLNASKTWVHRDLYPIIRDTPELVAQQKEEDKIKLEKDLKEFFNLHPVLIEAWELYINHEEVDYFQDAFFDIYNKLLQYGSLSSKQIEFCYNMLSDFEEKQIARKEQAILDANAEPVPVTDERMQITGKILATKYVENDWGGSMKSLVQDDRGFKVWGTSQADKGDRVTFMARVEVSQDDPKFGFYKRPTKVQIL